MDKDTYLTIETNNGEIYLIVNRESAEVIPLSTVVRARKGSRKAINKYYEHMSF